MDQEQQTERVEHRAVSADVAREQEAEYAAELARNGVVYMPTDGELTLATEWHGGQASMLYAVASTGALSLGTVRPSVHEIDGWRPMTDAEWRADLAWRLWRELRECAHQAEGQDDPDADAFREWCDKLDALSDRLAEAVEVSA